MAAKRIRNAPSEEYNPGENVYFEEDGLNTRHYVYTCTHLKSSEELELKKWKDISNLPLPSPLPKEEEERRIEEFLRKTDEEWKKHMASEIEVPRGRYICRRCGMRGHFIQHCPTISQFRWRNPLNT
ncbi:hypothetical protein SUGI_0815900 [Cryptomeria japonica]|nr:hypothetical protein SUGI_0815900 [Cryptomeria japonica]